MVGSGGKSPDGLALHDGVVEGERRVRVVARVAPLQVLVVVPNRVHGAGLLALLACLAGSLAQTDDDGRRSHNAPHEHAEAWIEQGGFVLLVVALFEMFYGLATVVEEFFVPALNIMVRQSLIQLHHIIFMLRCFALTNCIYVM